MVMKTSYPNRRCPIKLSGLLKFNRILKYLPFHELYAINPVDVC